MRKRTNPGWSGVTALGTLLCFIYSNIVYGAIEPAKNLWQDRRAAVSQAQPALLAQLPSLDADLLSNALPSRLDVQSQALNQQYAGLSAQVPAVLKSLPLNYASLKELYLPKDYKPGDLMVLHIQDAHGNLEAQKNIGRVIEALSSQHRVLVGLEGARGAFNFTPYRTFPDHEITRKAAGYLLQQSLITGPEYAAMTVQQLPAYWGVEEEKPYLDHVQAYLDSSQHEKEAQETENRLEEALAQVKKASFGARLAELDGKMTAYHQGRLGLGEYLRYLGAGSGRHTRMFLEALKLEKSLNYNAVEGQRKALTQALVAKLPKQDLDKLLQASLSYRVGNLTHGTFYRYLTDLCKNRGIALSHYPEMERYVRYVLASESISSEGLFRELRGLEQTRIRGLTKTPAEKKAIQLSQDLLLAEKVMSYGVSSAEWETYQARKEEIQSLPERLDRNNAPLKELLDSYGKFSQCALARNSILINNLLSKAREEKNTQLAILVTGGFHTSGMMAELRAKRIAYAVVTPRLGKVEGTGTEYLQVFRRDRTPLEKLFSGEKITLAAQVGTALEQMGHLSPDSHPVVKEMYSAFVVAAFMLKGGGVRGIERWLAQPEEARPAGLAAVLNKIEVRAAPTGSAVTSGFEIVLHESRGSRRLRIPMAVRLADPVKPEDEARGGYRYAFDIDGRRLEFYQREEFEDFWVAALDELRALGGKLAAAFEPARASSPLGFKLHDPEVAVAADWDEMGRVAARRVADLIRVNNAYNKTHGTHRKTVLGFATGTTPKTLYEELKTLYDEDPEGLSFEDVVTFNLDEYLGLPRNHDQTYWTFMHEELFNHVHVPPENVHFLRSDATDLATECSRYEQEIRDAGGIDLQILGIGVEGHIAFNEKGSPLASRTSVVDLDESTIRANADKYFHGNMKDVPTQALSMGIGTILEECREIILLANGPGKAQAIHAALEGPVGRDVPASFLRLHSNVHFIIDQDAAAMLSPTRREAGELGRPLIFASNWVSTLWGGDGISRLKGEPPRDGIGETWEVSTQVSHPSRFASGETLREALADPQRARRWLGERVCALTAGWFPILYKLLDARRPLSVHVHPDNATAERLAEADPGKSETWVVIHAEPGARIYAGLDRAKFRNARQARAWLRDALQSDRDPTGFMQSFEVRPGDVFRIDPGVIHSIGPGVLLAEVQGNSDLTYRLFDHDRGRPIQPVEAMAAMNFERSLGYDPRVAPRAIPAEGRGVQMERLTSDLYYETYRVSLAAGGSLDFDMGGDFVLVSSLQGGARILSDQPGYDVALGQGQSGLVPAAARKFRIQAGREPVRMLIIKPGSLPAPVPARARNATTATSAAQAALAVTVGGTKIAAAAVSPDGILLEGPRTEWRSILQERGTLTAEGFVELLAEEIGAIVRELESRHGIDRASLKKLGIAWPGPGDYARGIVSATFLPGFSDYPLKEALARAIASRLGMTGLEIEVLFDSDADILGELAADPGLLDGLYFDMSTGVSLSLLKNGKPVTAWSERGIRRGLGQLGRHLIRRPDGIWVYRPTPDGSVPPMTPGETRLTDWVGGPALARRFFAALKASPYPPGGFLGLDPAGLDDLEASLARLDARSVQFVLDQIQARAMQGHPFALSWIRQTGTDLGTALKVFLDAYPASSSERRLVIGGGIAEGFGRGIQGEKTSLDIFLQAVRAASGLLYVRRSDMGYQREFLAFKPRRAPGRHRLGARFSSTLLLSLPFLILLPPDGSLVTPIPAAMGVILAPVFYLIGHPVAVPIVLGMVLVGRAVVFAWGLKRARKSVGWRAVLKDSFLFLAGKSHILILLLVVVYGDLFLSLPAPQAFFDLIFHVSPLGEIFPIGTTGARIIQFMWGVILWIPFLILGRWMAGPRPARWKMVLHESFIFLGPIGILANILNLSRNLGTVHNYIPFIPLFWFGPGSLGDVAYFIHMTYDLFLLFSFLFMLNPFLKKYKAATLVPMTVGSLLMALGMFRLSNALLDRDIISHSNVHNFIQPGLSYVVVSLLLILAAVASEVFLKVRKARIHHPVGYVAKLFAENLFVVGPALAFYFSPIADLSPFGFSLFGMDVGALIVPLLWVLASASILVLSNHRYVYKDQSAGKVGRSEHLERIWRGGHLSGIAYVLARLCAFLFGLDPVSHSQVFGNVVRVNARPGEKFQLFLRLAALGALSVLAVTLSSWLPFPAQGDALNYALSAGVLFLGPNILTRWNEGARRRGDALLIGGHLFDHPEAPAGDALRHLSVARNLEMPLENEEAERWARAIQNAWRQGAAEVRNVAGEEMRVGAVQFKIPLYARVQLKEGPRGAPLRKLIEERGSAGGYYFRHTGRHYVLLDSNSNLAVAEAHEKLHAFFREWLGKDDVAAIRLEHTMAWSVQILQYVLDRNGQPRPGWRDWDGIVRHFPFFGAELDRDEDLEALNFWITLINEDRSTYGAYRREIFQRLFAPADAARYAGMVSNFDRALQYRAMLHVFRMAENSAHASEPTWVDLDVAGLPEPVTGPVIKVVEHPEAPESSEVWLRVGQEEVSVPFGSVHQVGVLAPSTPLLIDQLSGNPAEANLNIREFTDALNLFLQSSERWEIIQGISRRVSVRDWAILKGLRDLFNKKKRDPFVLHRIKMFFMDHWNVPLSSDGRKFEDLSAQEVLQRVRDHLEPPSQPGRPVATSAIALGGIYGLAAILGAPPLLLHLLLVAAAAGGFILAWRAWKSLRPRAPAEDLMKQLGARLAVDPENKALRGQVAGSLRTLLGAEVLPVERNGLQDLDQSVLLQFQVRAKEKGPTAERQAALQARAALLAGVFSSSYAAARRAFVLNQPVVILDVTDIQEPGRGSAIVEAALSYLTALSAEDGARMRLSFVAADAQALELLKAKIARRGLRMDESRVDFLAAGDNGRMNIAAIRQRIVEERRWVESLKDALYLTTGAGRSRIPSDALFKVQDLLPLRAPEDPDEILRIELVFGASA